MTTLMDQPKEPSRSRNGKARVEPSVYLTAFSSRGVSQLGCQLVRSDGGDDAGDARHRCAGRSKDQQR